MKNCFGDENMIGPIGTMCTRKRTHARHPSRKKKGRNTMLAPDVRVSLKQRICFITVSHIAGHVHDIDNCDARALSR